MDIIKEIGTVIHTLILLILKLIFYPLTLCMASYGMGLCVMSISKMFNMDPRTMGIIVTVILAGVVIYMTFLHSKSLIRLDGKVIRKSFLRPRTKVYHFNDVPLFTMCLVLGSIGAVNVLSMVMSLVSYKPDAFNVYEYGIYGSPVLFGLCTIAMVTRFIVGVTSIKIDKGTKNKPTRPRQPIEEPEEIEELESKVSNREYTQTVHSTRGVRRSVAERIRTTQAE